MRFALCAQLALSMMTVVVCYRSWEPGAQKPSPLKARKKPTAVPLVQAQPPCCSDLIGTLACRRLRRNNNGLFQQRCQHDADFSLLQCCATCGLAQVGQRHESFFKEGENSKHCFDRHGHAFCEAFVLKKDVWSPSNWSCSGVETAQLAFRVCRRSCGFCRRDLYADDRRPVDPSPFPAPSLCSRRRARWTKTQATPPRKPLHIPKFLLTIG